MPENSNNYIVTFNRANSKLQELHWNRIKDKFKEIFAPIQVQKMEEIPLEQNIPEEPEEKKHWTFEKNELPKNRFGRVRYGGQTFNLYGNAPITSKNGGNI